MSVSSFLSYVCVCISPVSQLFEIAFSTSLAETSMCTCVRACVCVYTDVFFRVRARRDFSRNVAPRRETFLTVFPTTNDDLFLSLGSDGLYPNPRTQTLISVFRTKIIEQKIRPKNTSSAFIIALKFEKSLEDERNVSPRDVITRRATTTSSGARRCC